MKKFKIIIIGIVVLLVLTIISIPHINNFKAYKVKNELLNIPLPEKTEVVESISKAGKLSGNGNGMQYLGAMLIHSDLPFEDLKAYYEKYADGWNGPYIEQPSGQVFDIANRPIQFSTAMDSEKYYVVHLWDSNKSGFLDLDIRGH